MKLIGQLDSPYVRRVAVSMTALDQSFERLPYSVFGDFERVRQLNPLGRVPALILHDGAVLVDSSAILDWLDDRVGPDRALFPPRGQARQRCWQHVALALGINEKLVSMVYEYRMRPADKRETGWLGRCRTQVDAALAALDAAAADADPWLVDNRLSQADITVGAMLSFLGFVVPVTGVAVPGSARLSHLARLAAACETLSAFQANVAPAAERPLPADFRV